MKLSKGTITLIVIFLVILADQTLKIWIKTHFYIGETYEIAPWFKLHFIENNGMAFGWQFGSKLLLTLFRIALTVLLIGYIWKIRKSITASVGYLVCIALITAGALGNIIDCTFYGIIFNNPAPPTVATLFPDAGGYGTFLHGRVVDMLYFPLFSWYWPDWLPFIGGERFEFFQPVFNIADAAISVGVIVLILLYRKSELINYDSPDDEN